MSARITRDEDDEFEGITVDTDEDVPEYAVDGRTAAVIITGPNDFHFEEPVWLHPQSAMEMHEAGVIEMVDGESVRVETNTLGITVFVYTTA